MQTLKRKFLIQSPPDILFALASTPLLAPQYLNFLKSISALPNHKVSDMWGAYRGEVSYRGILNLSPMIEHCVDQTRQIAKLRHFGDLAEFEAEFEIRNGEVVLTCQYQTKTAWISWFVGKALDRVLTQVAGAMDRYACGMAREPS